MIISIASGKGGTGKTTVAVNLALALENNVQYLDCDVEAPNGQIFIKPEFQKPMMVGTPLPEVDLTKCTYCGKCGEICQYHAIVVIQRNLLIFPELCHACAGCWLVCPEHGISPTDRTIGIIERGYAGGIEFIHGKLRIGEAMAPPLIRKVKSQMDPAKTVIIDAPPGTSCPVIEAVKKSDFVLLVTEPTPFGLNDLKLAVAMVRRLRLKFGVIINRCDIGNDELRSYCATEGIDILMEIKNDRQIAVAYSQGIPLVQQDPDYRSRFLDLYHAIERRVDP